MFNNKIQKILKEVESRFQPKIQSLQQKLQNFKPYDIGGYAINGLTPKKGYSVKPNLAYGLKARQRLDLYISDVEPSKALILFVHGGAWSRGDKQSYKFVGEAFSRYGYDVAVVNYHLAPEHIFPSYVDDLAVALNYLDTNQQKLGISTNQMILMGHSAGAFNIASLLYHPNTIDFKSKQNIKAMIGIAGPYHFDYKGDALAEDAFDAQIPYQNVMPYYFVERNSIKHYLFIADKDEIVKHSNTYDLHEQLLAQENHSEIINIEKMGHVSIMGSVSSLFSPFFKTRKEILKKLNEALD